MSSSIEVAQLNDNMWQIFGVRLLVNIYMPIILGLKAVEHV
jgi:hypothetical protein